MPHSKKPYHQGDLDIDKVGVTLEELKKIKMFPDASSHNFLLNFSEQVIKNSNCSKHF